MPLEDFMPTLQKIVLAAANLPGYPDLPGATLDIPSVLFYPGEGETAWQSPGPYDKWTHNVEVHILYSTVNTPQSDADAKAALEPIRAAIAAQPRLNWTADKMPGNPPAPSRHGVERAAVLKYRRSIITWAGIEYMALTVTVRVIEVIAAPQLHA